MHIYAFCISGYSYMVAVNIVIRPDDRWGGAGCALLGCPASSPKMSRPGRLRGGAHVLPVRASERSYMTRVEEFAKPFLALLLVWILLNGNLAADTLLIGVVASFAIVWFLRESLSFLSSFRATPGALVAAIRFVLYFLRELVRANIALARIVLSPSLPIRPGIVKVRTRLQSRVGRLLLANAITLTPGTLTVELEGEWLYVHWVSIESDDIDLATDRIVAGFEKYLEVIYG